MTNEELDEATVAEAKRIYGGVPVYDNSIYALARIAARLAREGWTPPEPVDPDLAEAEKLHEDWVNAAGGDDGDTCLYLLKAIKRGRELERDDAKPGMVWKEHDGSDVCPVDTTDGVMVQYAGGTRAYKIMAYLIHDWESVTHYAIITQPEEK